jgi:hypothetical protein
MASFLSVHLARDSSIPIGTAVSSSDMQHAQIAAYETHFLFLQ